MVTRFLLRISYNAICVRQYLKMIPKWRRARHISIIYGLSDAVLNHINNRTDKMNEEGYF